jgi:hypothetical protein
MRKLCILSLAAGTGPVIRDSLTRPERVERYFADCTPEQIELIRWHCDQIEAAGKQAYDTLTRGIRVDDSRVNTARRKIIELTGFGQDIDLLRLLSFTWLGLLDLQHHCQDPVLQPVIDAVIGFITVWDANLIDDDTHAAAMADYEGWLA